MSGFKHILKQAVNRLIGPAMRYRIKERINPPRFDGFLRIYPTLACNLRCSYCVNFHNPSEYKGEKYVPLSPEEWGEIINRTGRNVIITGGEPFLYPGLADMINRIHKDLIVKIYTNFSVKKTVSVMEKVQRPVVFYASYHPGSGPPDKFLRTITQVMAMGKYQGSIHAVETSDQKNDIYNLQKWFKKNGHSLTIDHDQFMLFPGASMKFRRTVNCQRRIILIAPDGTRYQCVSKMVRQKDPLGKITDSNPLHEQVKVTCHDYGYCAPCDGLGETSIRLKKD